MSTNVVAFLLLNKFRDGCTLEQLVEGFEILRQELETAHKDIAYCGESVDIINHAVCTLLKKLLSLVAKLITFIVL